MTCPNCGSRSVLVTETSLLYRHTEVLKCLLCAREWGVAAELRVKRELPNWAYAVVEREKIQW